MVDEDFLPMCYNVPVQLSEHSPCHLKRAAAAKLVDFMMHLIKNKILVVLQSEPPGCVYDIVHRKLIHNFDLLEINHNTTTSAAGDVSDLHLHQQPEPKNCSRSTGFTMSV
jgi:hypothetical protein